MNICMIAYAYYETDNRIRRYSEELVRQGHTVDAIVIKHSKDPSFVQIEGVNVYRIKNREKNEQSKWNYLFRLLDFFIRSFIFVTYRNFRSKYDIIHVHNVPDFEVFVVIIPKLMGSKIILDIHDILPEFFLSKFDSGAESIFYKFLVLQEKLSAKFADHIIISNDLWKKKIVSRSVSEDKCTTILNYTDTSVFYPQARVKSLDKYVLFYGGTLNYHQGLDLAIKAVAQVHQQHKNVLFHIYGAGPEKNALLRLIDALDMKNVVLYHKSVNITELAYQLSQSDLGIVPKRNDNFGGTAFSTKIMEFMTVGIPVVAARTIIDEYYFNDGQVQFFEPDNADDLANKIIKIKENKVLNDRLVKNGKIYMAQNNWEHKKNLYLDIVARLTQN